MKEKGIRAYTTGIIILAFSMSLATGIIGILLNHIVEYYKLNSVQSGLISSIFSIGSAVSVALALILKSKVKKPVLIISLTAVLAAAFALSGVPVPFAVFLVFCFFVGIGYGATDAFMDASLADMHKEKTGKYLGIRHGCFGIVGILAPIIIGAALGYVSWHVVYLALGLIAGVSALFYFLVHRKYTGVVEASCFLEKPLARDDFRAFGHSGFIFLALSMFFTVAGQNGIIVWVVRYVSAYQNHPEIATYCLSLFWLSSTVIRFIMPYIPVCSEKKICIGALGGGVFWALGVLIGTAPAMLICCFMTGLFVGSLFPLNIGLGTAMFSSRTGMITAILSFTKYIAQIVVPMIIGALMSVLPAKAAILTAAVMYFCNAGAALCLLKAKKQKTAE